MNLASTVVFFVALLVASLIALSMIGWIDTVTFVLVVVLAGAVTLAVRSIGSRERARR